MRGPTWKPRKENRLNYETKLEIVERANKRRAGISDEKGPEYAGSDTNYKDDDADVLANFKRQGKRFNVSPLLAAGIYAGKHIDSFETTVRAIEACLSEGDVTGAFEVVQRGEGFVSRLDDLRNYCDLLECILYELRIHPNNVDLVEPKVNLLIMDVPTDPDADLECLHPNFRGEDACTHCAELGVCLASEERVGG